MIWAALAAVLMANAAGGAIVTPGCQGELCLSTGEWIAKRDSPVFATLGSRRQVGHVPEGTRVTALGTWIVTTRAGTAVVRKAGTYWHHATPQVKVQLSKGQKIRTLYEEGEGLIMAMDGHGRRFSIDRTEYRSLTPFEATDWVRLRVAPNRLFWSNRSRDFLCSSHIDVEPGQCGGISAHWQ